MWRSILDQLKGDGLNMVEVYLFWNYHEQKEGTFDWQGRGDMVKFIQTAHDAGLFVNLRVGPYVCAEWDYGGIPEWLGFKDGVKFRTYNSVWMNAMQGWFQTVLQKLRPFFANQGGPIVLMQVENELHGAPDEYVEWCGTMAAKFDTGVPVLMCNGMCTLVASA